MAERDDDPARAAMQLYRAVEEDDQNEVKRLLVIGGNVHYKYFDDKSLLHICCEKDRLECAKLLIEFGANIQARDEWNMTPLMYCMVRQFSDIAQELLSHDPSAVHAHDKFGTAAIHCAVETGSVQLLKLLFDHGVHVDQADWFGITPLMSLCSRTDITNQVALCEMLFDAGADVHLKGLRSRRTALQYAAMQKNVTLVQMLLVAGADPNSVDTAWRTPITNLIYQCYRLKDASSDVDEDVMTIVIMLTQAGANLNMNVRENSSALCMAAAYRVEMLVRFFLESGADSNIRFPQSVTPLLVAVKKKDVGCVRALLSWAARSDIKGRVYRTAHVQYWVDAMELAVDLACWDIVFLLYSAGYNISSLPYLREGALDEELPESLLGNVEIMSWLKFLARSPKSLFHLTTLCIWAILSENIGEKLKQLPLPSTIKQFMSPEVLL